MIAFLRFFGLMNAAIWLGAVVFFTLAAGPACVSPAVEKLLGAKNFPFFSEAFAQLLLARYFIFLSISALVALLHLVAEWLYMGRPTRKTSMILLAGLLGLVLIGGTLMQPHLKQLHARRHAPNSPANERTAAAQSLQFWQVSVQLLNLTMLAGLVVYVWRIANPSDAPRFISSVKFRG